MSERGEWFLKRKQVVTATDVGAIVGLSPYRTAFDVWRDKTRDDIPPDAVNDAMTWGNRLEPVIAAAYSELYKIPVVKAEFVRRDFDGVPCGCTPDYLSEDGKINVEIKTARSSKGWGDAGTDEIPDYYLTQVMFQAGVTGRKMSHLAVLIGASDFRVYNIPFDQQFFDSLINATRSFWAMVLTKTPPAVDGSDSCREYYAELFKRGGKDLVVNPSAILSSSAVKFFKIQRLLKAIEEKKDVLSNEIIAEIGDAGGVRIDGLGKLTVVRSAGRESVSYKNVVEALKPTVAPEIMETILKANTKQSAATASLRTYPEKE